MGQAFTWCFAAPVFLFMAMVVAIMILGFMAKTIDATEVSGAIDDSTANSNTRSLDCLRCHKRLRYVVPEVLVRCSCGNVMQKPSGPSATCPKCLEVVHVTRSGGLLRVKCPCGNVASVKP